MKANWFGQHLYQPLLHMQDKIVEISPVPLNRGERTFVEDLKAFHDKRRRLLRGKELYLLRNLSKGKASAFRGRQLPTPTSSFGCWSAIRSNISSWTRKASAKSE